MGSAVRAHQSRHATPVHPSKGSHHPELPQAFRPLGIHLRDHSFHHLPGIRLELLHRWLAGGRSGKTLHRGGIRCVTAAAATGHHIDERVAAQVKAPLVALASTGVPSVHAGGNSLRVADTRIQA